MYFVSLFFLNERNITVTLLMIHLKCTVVHYANLYRNSINQLYLGPVEYAISFFFNFLFMFILKSFPSKTLRKNYHFLKQISKIHFKMYYITEYQDVKTNIVHAGNETGRPLQNSIRAFQNGLGQFHDLYCTNIVQSFSMENSLNTNKY